jgi:5,10-methylene-tetrahydrofolate dehydrogenase/methenyl tetrahydrofolate cyclohydrolase
MKMMKLMVLFVQALQNKLMSKKVLMAVDPSKDVDGFHPRILENGIDIHDTLFLRHHLELLERYGVETRKAYRSYWTQSYCGSPNEYFDG